TKGARRASSSRSRTTRGKRATRPRLTPRQGREIAGVLLLLVALLGLLAIASTAGSILTGLRGWLMVTFGRAWFVPVGGSLAFGGYLLWLKAPRPRPLDVVAGGVAVVALIGLFGLAANAGGSLGSGVDRIVIQVVGHIGAWALLTAGLLIGLIVTVHFSPGTLIATVVRAGRAAFVERNRLQKLVTPLAAPQVPVAKAASPSNAALARAAASLATPPPAVETPLWEVEEPAHSNGAPAAVAAVAEREPRAAPVIRVVAESEDDVPEIEWKLPSITLLDTVTARRERMADEIKRNVRIIESTLETFGVACKVVGVNPGPAVTQYELQPGPGVQVKRITSLQNDLSLALAAAPLRIEAPIPGKAAVGIEVPNKSASLVTIREVLETAAFREGTRVLALGLGNDVSGASIVADLTRMPHLLIAGATGQGKSVCINALITSLLFQMTPEHMRLLLIDPKRVELTGYNGLPHLALPVLVESHQAAAALRWAVAEMDRRYKMFSAEGVRNIAAYNEKAIQRLAHEIPYVVIVIDELADLMMVAADEIEELICRIAQLARAVGIHLVIATQRPSTDIITGLIKANIPSRIAFAVGSQVDSRVILDSGGAEKLLGRGDMLYQPVDAGKPTRIQGAFVSDPEVEAVVNFWRAQGAPRFMEEILEEGTGSEWEGGQTSERKLDPLFARAARAVAAEGAASVSLVQRKFNVGYSRAGRIVDQLAENHVVGGYQGSKSREVMMNLPDVDDLLERLGIE
ncbi:MAG: FtsK/SpoIIIE domain-containing protein, partial [Candidatus Dormibacteraeota bacterium]|nr:FtsK/SpoIIIE domain-containing protein [Candidatus Dormibacteraeota bacterium]